jgi:hypothetical protein
MRTRFASVVAMVAVAAFLAGFALLHAERLQAAPLDSAAPEKAADKAVDKSETAKEKADPKGTAKADPKDKSKGKKPTPPKPVGPVKVEVRKNRDGYQLFVDGKQFFVKGAGLEFGNQESLAKHGGNAFRTWRTENGKASGKEVLDRAAKNKLYVVMGLDVGRERLGFNYNDEAAVKKQLEAMRAEVLKYKDHPALIVWGIGNELNMNSSNPKVWNAVNDISKMIHEVDPNHLTMTAIAGADKRVIQEIQTRAPDLDFLSFQMYAGIVVLPKALKDAGYTKPYMVTEWGATGHWEVGKTQWGAPIENDSTQKADLYQKRFDSVIRANTNQCIGNFVFLWEQKQERTPTWYGMFLDTGEETPAVDAMHRIWNADWPANRSPALFGMWLDDKTANHNVHLKAGKTYEAKIKVSDPDKDPLTYLWEVLPESTDLKSGGDLESRPKSVPGLIADPKKAEISLAAPAKPGAYRLYVYVFDGKNHAAHANIPFFVDP